MDCFISPLPIYTHHHFYPDNSLFFAWGLVRVLRRTHMIFFSFFSLLKHPPAPRYPYLQRNSPSRNLATLIASALIIPSPTYGFVAQYNTTVTSHPSQIDMLVPDREQETHHPLCSTFCFLCRRFFLGLYYLDFFGLGVGCWVLGVGC